MKVTATPLGTFRLEAETPADFDFIGECDVYRVARMSDVSRPPGVPSVSSVAIVQFPGSVPNPTGQTISAFSQLFRLGLTQATTNRHVRAYPTDPQIQEKLSALLKQLKFVVNAFGDCISHDEFVAQKVDGAHVGSNEKGAGSVAQQGMSHGLKAPGHEDQCTSCKGGTP